ncbi:type VI secretion system baseplate subunit TssG, partial [Bacteroides thetaiotaomicron]
MTSCPKAYSTRTFTSPRKYRRNRCWTKSASTVKRNFRPPLFKPSEISLDHMLVAFQNKERRIDEMNVHPDFVSIFSGQWPVLELLPTHLAVMFVHMLVYMEQITASLSKNRRVHDHSDRCARAYQERRQMRWKWIPALFPNWGAAFWGDDMVLGNSFADGTYQMLVEIGPLSARRMESFFPGAADSKILNALTELFLLGQGDTDPLHHPAGRCPVQAGNPNRTRRLSGYQHLFMNIKHHPI